MIKKRRYRTVFISDIHLWHPRSRWDKLIKFLSSIDFENLIIIWDFIDYPQLKRFWKWWKKEERTLNYINKLAKNWINTTYIQWNHDRKLKCTKEIQIENMTICREMYYKSLIWKIYYITHWDCIDRINRNWNNLWLIWIFISWILLKIEHLWNKKVYTNSHLSIADKLEQLINKIRMSDEKWTRKVKKLKKNLNCDGVILWHFHMIKHCQINWIDYFCTWDWRRNCSAVVEDLKWNLEVVKYK